MQAVSQSAAVGSAAVAVRAVSSGSLGASRVSASRSASQFTNNALSCKVPAVQRGAGSRAVVCMAKEGAAAGYAAALVEVGKSTKSLEAVHRDVEALTALTNNAELLNFLASPVAADEKKKSVLKAIATEGAFSPYTLNFLNLLVDKRRISIVRDVLASFEELYCEETDTQVAIVTSAVKLENSQQALIAKKIQSITGAKNIKLKNVVDSSLIAGFIVKYGKDGSLSVDMSVKGQLDRLAAQFDLSESSLSTV